jgi:hypothetical protein
MTAGTFSPIHTAMRVFAWGKTAHDAVVALEMAAVGAGRVDWEFVSADCTSRMPCPLDLGDPYAVAAEQDPSDEHAWAYVVYQAAGRADG